MATGKLAARSRAKGWGQPRAKGPVNPFVGLLAVMTACLHALGALIAAAPMALGSHYVLSVVGLAIYVRLEPRNCRLSCTGS